MVAVAGRQRVSTVTVPAPWGGWNARDNIADMEPLDAVILQNLWPGTNNVTLRGGYTRHATGISGQVETVMTYNSGTASTMFGAAGINIYDVTAAGAVGAASKTGMTNARYQYVNFTNSGGSYLLAVNGADKMIGWNGSAWYQDGDGAHDISGFDTSTSPNIAVFKNRIWFIQTGTLKAWYLGSQALSGAATSLDMSSLCQLGGYLMAAMTWTVDGGYGVDDYLMFITSEGEVLQWRLTDPSTPSGIALVGVFNLGAPVGRRCWIKYGGDLLIITQDGVIPMSGALQSSRTDPKRSITDKIQFAMSSATGLYGSHFGWQLLLLAKGNRLYLNVPVSEGSQQQQFVQNNITQAWCNYTGWESNCWEILDDEPYFGGNGFVGHAESGTTDNNASIPGLAIQSFQQYGGATQKQCKMIRYHFQTDGNPAIYGNVNVDYDTADYSAQLSTSSGGSAGLWGTGVWDTAVWGAGLSPSADWQGATGIGYTFAPFLKTATNGIQLQWSATDLVFELGGIL